jgi:hypothetical protein
VSVAASRIADRCVHRLGHGRRAGDRIKRGVKGVPRQDRAFDARRKIACASEYHEDFSAAFSVNVIDMS